jgi:hypothetical protein
MSGATAPRGMSSGAVARRPAPAGRIALAVAAEATVLVVDGWRLAVLLAVCAAMVGATRIRFASYAAVALLVVCAAIVSVSGPVSVPLSRAS